VIKTFRDRETERLFATGSSRRFQQCDRQAFQKLRMLDAARALGDLSALRGNRLEALKGRRQGQYSIRINDRHRICFGCEAAMHSMSRSRIIIERENHHAEAPSEETDPSG
jgi:proteic killer suppression protein